MNEYCKGSKVMRSSLQASKPGFIEKSSWLADILATPFILGLTGPGAARVDVGLL